MKPTQSCQPGSCEDALKPGFHLIVRIVPITPVVSKNFETIRTKDDLWFPFDRLDRINDKRRGVVSDVFGSDNRIFARVLQTSNAMMDFNWRVNLKPCYPLCLSILQRRQAGRVPRRHNGLSLVSNSAHTRCEHFCTFFCDFSSVQVEFILDYWNNSDDFWDSLRSSLSSQSSESVSISSLPNLHDRPARPAAILVSQNNETVAMLVYLDNPVGVELFSYANAFFCSNKFA